MTPDDIDDQASLFGEDGIGLDSIDALELIVLLEKEGKQKWQRKVTLSFVVTKRNVRVENARAGT